MEILIHKVAAAARSATPADNDLVASAPTAQFAEAGGRPMPPLAQSRPPRRLLAASPPPPIRCAIVSGPLNANTLRVGAAPRQRS